MAFPREYRGAYLERRRACGFRLYEAVGVARGDREAYAKQGFENYKLFGAPHVAIITSDEALGTYGVVDCGAYVSNFLLAAQSQITILAQVPRPIRARGLFPCVPAEVFQQRGVGGRRGQRSPDCASGDMR